MLLIYGGGPVGLMMAMAAKSLEAIPFVVEQNPVKFQRSEKFRGALGIEGALDGHSSTFDVVVNAAPSPGILPEGIDRLKAGGCFCLFSGLTGNTAYPASLLNEIHYRQLHLTGAYGCTRRQMEWALTVLNALSEPAACLIDGIIDLEEVPAALKAILAGNALKFIAKL
jgi:L-iditol 2-dehydrogenase